MRFLFLGFNNRKTKTYISSVKLLCQYTRNMLLFRSLPCFVWLRSSKLVPPSSATREIILAFFSVSTPLKKSFLNFSEKPLHISVNECKLLSVKPLDIKRDFIFFQSIPDFSQPSVISAALSASSSISASAVLIFSRDTPRAPSS